jgi:hypothetical protein
MGSGWVTFIVVSDIVIEITDLDGRDQYDLKSSRAS